MGERGQAHLLQIPLGAGPAPAASPQGRIRPRAAAEGSPTAPCPHKAPSVPSPGTRGGQGGDVGATGLPCTRVVPTLGAFKQHVMRQERSHGGKTPAGLAPWCGDGVEPPVPIPGPSLPPRCPSLGVSQPQGTWVKRKKFGHHDPATPLRRAGAVPAVRRCRRFAPKNGMIIWISAGEVREKD